MSGLRQQKSWAAWLLPVMLPLICFGAAAAIMSIPPDTQGVDIVAGRDLFRANCGACHFAKMGFPAHHGPNLHEIGRTGAHRRPDMTAPEYILESILDPAAFVAPGSRPGMPLNVATQLTPEEVRNIVGFLASRAARPDYAQIRQLEIPDRRTDENESIHVGREQMEVAWRVLTEKGQCLECHTLYATPNDRIMAPALFSAGLTDRQYVRDSIRLPDQKINVRYQMVTIELQDGQVISGRILSRDDHEIIVLRRADTGQSTQQSIALTDIELLDGELAIHPSTTSFMPGGLDKLLTAEELEAVEILIHQLN